MMAHKGMFSTRAKGVAAVLLMAITAGCASSTKPGDTPKRSLSDNHVEGSPAWTYAKYLEAWRDQDWVEMARRTQVSWRVRQSDPVQALKDRYDFRKLVDIRIGASRKVNRIMVDVPATVRYRLGEQLEEKEITARVVRESGVWGVNPISTLRQK